MRAPHPRSWPSSQRLNSTTRNGNTKALGGHNPRRGYTSHLQGPSLRSFWRLYRRRTDGLLARND